MNPMIEVLLTVQFDDPLIHTLEEISPRLRITSQPARKVEEIPEELWARAEVLYTDRVLPPPEMVPNLRWVQLHWAGIDSLVDHPLLNRPEIAVTNLSGSNAPQVAEWIVMMMLALGHRMPAMIESQAKSEWSGNKYDRYLPQELRGSTVGLVGYGSINRQVARLLQPFDVTILASKRDVMHPADNGYVHDGFGDPEGDLFHRLYPAQALKSMLKECDFVVVAVPYSKENVALIGAEELKAMKPTAFLLNVARGAIIDQDALISALKDNKIAGAALDVFTEEPLPANSPLWRLPNVLISPHISGSSKYYKERAVQLFADNLNRYLVGMPLFNRHDPERGY